MKKISVIGHTSIDFVNFMLELAQAFSSQGKTSCMLKHNYALALYGGKESALSELNTIMLDYSNASPNEVEYCLVDTNVEDSDIYLLVIEPNMISLNAAKSELSRVNPEEVYLVYLNALEGKVGIDYLVKFQLDQIFSGIIKNYYEIAFDEKNAEIQFASQLDGRLDLQHQSKEKRQILATLVKDVLKLDKKSHKTLVKNISRGSSIC